MAVNFPDGPGIGRVYLQIRLRGSPMNGLELCGKVFLQVQYQTYRFLMILVGVLTPQTPFSI